MRLSKRTVAGAVAGAAVAAGLIIGNSAAGPTAFTFDGDPPAPASLPNTAITDWDIQVHSRDVGTWYELESMQAQHGADCSAPPATHFVSAYEDTVFQCRNHVMTAINAGGYGVVYLTPNVVFDFSGGGSITWEMSTERLAQPRDWIDLLITPYAQNMAVPLLSDLSQGVDLNGYAPNMVHVGLDNGEGAPRLKVVRNGVTSCPTPCGFTPSLGDGIPASVNQAATRQTFKLTISNGRIKFERLASSSAPALVYWDAAASLNFTSGVVQFGHHSYNPTKDGGQPGTWHWDNFTFSSGTPFTMIKADRRYVDSAAQTLTFNAPAPANASLRFAAIGRVSVSFDGGPFNVVDRQPSVGDAFHADHMSSYFVPMPQGARSVRFGFAADNGYSGPFMAKDFAIWSLGGAAPATATPTRTATPTPSSTPSSSPTATVSPTPGATNVAATGIVLAEGRPSAAGIVITAEPGGITATASASGSFTLSGLQANTPYTLTARLPGFLTARKTNLRISSGTAQLGTTTLRAGDADADDAVTILDVSLVAGLYGAPAAGSPADFNGNGTIDVTDVSLAAGNYNLAGPTAW